jgi:hypothetical protein
MLITALRAAVDGAIVARTLKRRGAGPLLASVPAGGGRHDPEHARRVSGAVDRGIALVPMVPTCLRRSLTLVRELRRLGLAGTVHIGVRKVSGRVEAHAWVQVGDTVVNDDPAVTTTYTELTARQLEQLPTALR